MNEVLLNVDYFQRKFEAIPDELWCVGEYENDSGQRCAFGHCGMSFCLENDTAEAAALASLFARLKAPVAYVNDGRDFRFSQATPKARILAALEAIKSQTKS